ncbi:hypothetical protein IZ6_13710 [Terrihabitans soli]|uniref:DUF177 domain-containing protein n=1 Tax=Terrihabitans soli TaxID=708113 RepID=A0A6S6QMM8_9HYPH|nr:DUF177 domain-containing protein [Terrihabitans soli]BCJ90636.1 hypothetical protein IZ6_13710 [Terrihabitans soli]
MTQIPFSRPVPVQDVSASGKEVTVTADPAERAALAKFLKIPEVRRFEAHFTLKPRGTGGLSVTGELDAEIVQTCVVTLEDFPAEVKEEIAVRYVETDEVPPTEPGEEHEADLDAPDVLINGTADLGMLAAEHLALGLDPYPRKPGVQAPEAPAEEAPATHKPFAGLDKLVGLAKPGKK